MVGRIQTENRLIIVKRRLPSAKVLFTRIIAAGFVVTFVPPCQFVKLAVLHKKINGSF